MKIILGSSSKFRKQAFSKIVENFETLSPDIDEQAIRDDDPRKMTIKIAHAKADAIAKLITEPAIVITADQVTVVNGEVREKPRSEEEARYFMRSYDDQPVEIISGVVAMNTETGARAEGNDTVRIKFKVIPDKVIDQLIEEGDVMLSSGGLKAEHEVMQEYIETKEGTDESLQGVPVDLTRRLIEEVK